MPESSGAGGTYYVSPTGSDTRANPQAQNPATPWQTIRKALASVPLNGSIIEVADGVYPSSSSGPYQIDYSRAADEADPITVRGASKWGATVIGAPANGFTLGAWIHGGARGLRIEDLAFSVRGVTGAGATGVQIEQCDWVEVYGCRFLESGGMSMVTKGWSTGRSSTNIRLDSNYFGPTALGIGTFIALDATDPYFASKGSHALYLGQSVTSDNDATKSGTDFSVVCNNVFRGTAKGRHIQLGPQFRNGWVVNNTMYGNRPGFGCVAAPNNCFRYAGSGVEVFHNYSSSWNTSDNVIANNIMMYLTGHAAYGSASQALLRNFVRNNIAWLTDNGFDGTTAWQGASGTDFLGVYSGIPLFTASGNVRANPLLTDPANGDFRISSQLSPAFGNSELEVTPLLDFSGNARSASAPTIGALELVASGGGGGGGPTEPTDPPPGPASIVRVPGLRVAGLPRAGTRVAGLGGGGL